MTLPFVDPTYRIYLALAQYPVLQTHIRALMREELFSRGIMEPGDFKNQVREQSIESQLREGLTDPYGEEPTDVWRTRMNRVQAYLTDLHFSNNFPFELFEEVARKALEERGAIESELLHLNAEIATQDLLIEQALTISRMPPAEREKYEPRLEELKVVIIRNMISDQLAYIKIAKKWLTLSDLMHIRQRKIGTGKIGGKAAGMLLAQRILQETGDEALKTSIKIPESYFLAADVMYAFMAFNGLMHWAEQKYKDEEQIREDYDQIQEEYLKGEFPPDILEELQNILHNLEDQPIIVRSSSLLEDNFGTSFAGKYDSFFCPNQGTPSENLKDFIQAIIKVYASALNPDALLYRRSRDLQDYDERIAVLIQTVQGEKIGDYFFPHAAGVAFSRNMYRWSPQIERDAGFIRLVWGLGTRAVDRVGSDYPRLVALSHPLLHSHANPKAIKQYSQKEIDLINLKKNQFETLPAHPILPRRSPILRYLAQLYKDDYLIPLHSNLVNESRGNLVINFDEWLRRTPMAERMRKMLQILADKYGFPVDMEFTAKIINPSSTNPEIEITILQCRPQSHLEELEVEIPAKLLEEDVVFSTTRMMPTGLVNDIGYVLFVSPEGYYSLPTPAARVELGKAIGRLNKLLKEEVFICIGPGRWGTTNPDLGVRIGYADIYNARSLIELSGQGVGNAPEPSYGTHFFQDLMESQIYPLAIYLDDEDTIFNREFFYNSPNHLLDFLPDEEELKETLFVIKVSDFRSEDRLELIMDDEKGQAVAFFDQAPPPLQEDA